MHFGANGLIPVNMWQQFEFEITSENAPLKVDKGYIKTDRSPDVEIMSKGFFTQNKGVQLQDFLFSRREKIEKDFIASEVIETSAGVVIARHYRKKRNGQIIDFWISKEVGPISLVKLISKDNRVSQNNYSIELSSIIKNVKPTIDPKSAKPISTRTKKLFKID